MISFFYEDLGLISYFYNIDRFVIHLFPRKGHWCYGYYNFDGSKIFGIGCFVLIGWRS